MRACLFSGGKDSTLALHKMHAAKRDVELLITMVSENEYSYMFHKPNIAFTKMQAEAMGIRHIMHDTKGEKEEELQDLEMVLKVNEVTELVTGAIASDYQRQRIDRICKVLSIDHIAPLWGIDPLEELDELARDYKVIITQVAAEGFDESFLGAVIDGSMIEKLKGINKRYGVNLLFEGGEAESFVLDAPMFKRRIQILEHNNVWSGMGGRYVIEKAALRDK